MTIKRKQDWPERLHDALLARRDAAFTWGTTDCLMTVAGFVEAMTGADPAAGYRGKYSTKTGALTLAVQSGCNGFEELVAKIAAANGFPEITPKLAQRGDVVVFDTPDGPSFGIVHLNGRDAVCAGETGLQRLPVLSARRAWRV